ncbi:uroporphyrinogen decarboxylase/cobalamine-independent methonine synthase family protein [Maribacter thermophilus]|uniref:hypothetical protein n=1 Tax=Maribacter thermophilus TaxID=1197874 RepID=UPI000640EAF9|nr:hypothetical protein [Maribacter thermophilus]
MYRLLAYLKFLLSSTNQHGVHSPFVYNFITKSLYQKRNKRCSITEDVLFKSISYFKYKKVGLIQPDNSLKSTLDSKFGHLEYNTTPYDIIFTDSKNELLDKISKQIYHNDSALLVQGIHNSKERTRLWESIKKLPEVTVSIDLFYCGLIFFRREQAKQHFKIRI